VSLLDIHANLSYAAIAPIIGLEPFSSHTLSAKCPYCSAFSWSIYQDSKNLEEWHYCFQCKATGSIIAMAAERLGLSEQDAVEYLAGHLNTKLNFKTIKEFHLSQTKKAAHDKVWENARQRLLKPNQEELKLLKKLGCLPSVNLNRERLLAGPGNLFGLASNQFIEEQEGMRKYALGRKAGIVVPYFKTPTVIGGFDFISKKGIINYTGWRRDYRLAKGDLGFVGLPSALASRSEAVVATSMLSNLLQLQVRHFSSSLKPLPLVGYRVQTKEKTSREWYALADKNIVIWEREPTAQIVNQAMVLNASLSFVGPAKDRNKGREVKGPRWKSWISKISAADAWKRIVANSRPYKEALKVWARSASSDQKLRLLRDAEMYNEETAKLVRSVVKPKISSQVGKRVRVPVAAAKSRLDGNYNSTVITERDGKWYDVKNRLLIGGVINVDYIVVRGDSREYAGKLVVDGESYPFVVDYKKANIQWLREFALLNEVYLEERFFEDNHFSTKVNPFDVAVHMQSPEVVAGLSSVGWDGSGFQFKAARLFKGNFEQNPDFKLPSNVPGPRQNYCRMRKEVEAALSKTGDEMEVTWAMATALCAQVSAPAAGLWPIGIWVQRDLDPFMQSLWGRFEIKIGDYREWEHKWPRRLVRPDFAVRQDDTGFFVVNSPSYPKYKELIAVDALGDHLQPRLVTHSADKIILNYLRHFTTCDIDEVASWEDWLGWTHSQMYKAFPFVDTSTLQKAMAKISIT
jgi:hypothetical protein